MTHVQPISKKSWYLLDRLPDQIVSYLWDQIEEAKKENPNYQYHGPCTLGPYGENLIK